MPVEREIDVSNLAITEVANRGGVQVHEVNAKMTLSPISIRLHRYEDERYKTEPFDVVIDCVGWRDEWKEAFRRGVLKSGWHGGRYISIAATDDPQVHTVWQVIKHERES